MSIPRVYSCNFPYDFSLSFKLWSPFTAIPFFWIRCLVFLLALAFSLNLLRGSQAAQESVLFFVSPSMSGFCFLHADFKSSFFMSPIWSYLFVVPLQFFAFSFTVMCFTSILLFPLGLFRYVMLCFYGDRE